MYKGNTVTLGDFKAQGYKYLTFEDAQCDPSWNAAPVLVATNRERLTITHWRAQQFARDHNTVVIRWQSRRKKWDQKPVHPHQVEAAMEDPCFYEYFVKGANGFFTKNVNKDLGLVNSTSATYHSLKVDPIEERHVQQLIRASNPGDIITLEYPPMCINVEVTKTRESSESAREALFDFSLYDNRIDTLNYLIPVSPALSQDSNTIAVRGGEDYLPSRVQFYRRFPLDPGFAITAHKSQGRTMDKVIIALSHNPAPGCSFSYAQLHVAMSRVRRRDDIRLFLNGISDTQKWRSIQYVSLLQPDPSIEFFFDGFRSREGSDANLNWKEDAWDLAKANSAYEAKHPNLRALQQKRSRRRARRKFLKKRPAQSS
jgi:hypothetical protein